MLQLEISEPAQADIQSAYDWWRVNRSEEQALRWYHAIYDSIREMRQNAFRFPRAPEGKLHPAGLRQMLFGIGGKPTHRIVFTVENDVVRIVRVRHSSQQNLRASDLA